MVMPLFVLGHAKGFKTGAFGGDAGGIKGGDGPNGGGRSGGGPFSGSRNVKLLIAMWDSFPSPVPNDCAPWYTPMKKRRK
jgi:hypothetical protein